MTMKAFTSTVIAAALIALCPSSRTDEREEKSPYPGFRPECEGAAAFVSDVKNAETAVFPTIIRTPTNTTFSTDSQQQIVSFLNHKKVTRAAPDRRELSPGDIKGRGQFDWFQNDMAVLGSELRKQKIEADYVMVMEVLFPPTRGNRQEVFGVHCILLNDEGGNVFSFLLNSHHQAFVDAGMAAEDQSEKSRSELIMKATAVGLEALVQQIELAGEE